MVSTRSCDIISIDICGGFPIELVYIGPTKPCAHSLSVYGYEEDFCTSYNYNYSDAWKVTNVDDTGYDNYELNQQECVFIKKLTIKEIPKNIFYQFNAVRYFKMINQDLERLSDKSFDHAENLLYLDLSENKLETFSWKVFEYIRDLIALNLSGNKIHTITDLKSYQSTSIRWLDLSDNNLNNIFNQL